MRIIHMSDIHLAQGGRIIWNTDTKSHFDKAIDIIKEMRDIDAIIVSGDVSNDGTEWTYQYFDEKISSLGIPTYCCPGNHDNIDIMFHRYSSNSYQIKDDVLIKGWRFYFLNSVVPDDDDFQQNKARGYLEDKVLVALEKSLISNHAPSVIVLHHPPQEPGGWLNRKLLDNREEFNEIISRYSHVRMVLYGHIHYNLQHEENGILYSSAPSIGYAFDKNLPKFQIAYKQEGFDLIEIGHDAITINKINIHH